MCCLGFDCFGWKWLFAILHENKFHELIYDTHSEWCLFQMSGEDKPVESYWEQLKWRKPQPEDSAQKYLMRLREEPAIRCSRKDLMEFVDQNSDAVIFPCGNYPEPCYKCDHAFGAFLRTIGFSSNETYIVWKCFKDHGILTFQDLGEVKASKLVKEILLLDDADERIYDGQLSQIQLDKLANELMEAKLIQTEAATATSGMKRKVDNAFDCEPEQVVHAKQHVRAFFKRLQYKAIWKKDKKELKMYFKPFARVQRGSVIPMPGVKVILDLVKNPKEAKFIEAMTKVAETLGLEYKEMQTNLEECPAGAGWDEDENYERFKQLKICFKPRSPDQ